MPQVYGILETALYVNDLQSALEFYQKLFDFKILLNSDRLIALDVVGRNVLLLFKTGASTEPSETPGGIIPPHNGCGSTHFAFSIVPEDFQQWKERLESAGVPIESIVSWPGGAQSLYFRDPDQHLVELLTPGFWRIY